MPELRTGAMIIDMFNSSQKKIKMEKLLFLKNQELISENTDLAEYITFLSAELETEIIIRDLIDKIGESINLDETLAIIVKEIAELTNSDRCIIYLAKKKNTKDYSYKEFKIQENKKLLPENLELYTLFEDFYRNVQTSDDAIATDGNAIIIKNIDFSELNYKQKQYLNYYKVKSLIITPITHKDELLGLILVHQRDWQCDWNDTHSESLKKISNQAALSIKHSILYARLAQETELKSKIINNMPVEFKNHINSLMGFSEMLLKHQQNKLSDKQKQYLTNIIMSADLLNKAINDMISSP